MVEGDLRAVCRALQLPDIVGEVFVEAGQGLVVGRAPRLGLVRREQCVVKLLEALQKVLDEASERAPLCGRDRKE